MADRSDKKAKQRLKRERKRLALRKANAISPYRKAANGRLVAVRANADWRERGQGTVFVLREKPGGGLAMAVLFVDLWCAGLKDAWGRLDILREEFDEAVGRMDEQMDGAMADVPLAEAVQIVAGGIRFAVQNGFRLPAHYTRWTNFLGPLDAEHADLTHFGVEGGTKLRWVAPLYDLRRRLIGSTVEEFLARKDVEAIFDVEGSDDLDEFALESEGDNGDDEDEDDDDEDDDAEDFANDLTPAERARALAEMGRSINRVAEAVRQWCFAEGLVPSERLPAATAMVLGAFSADDARRAGGETVERDLGARHPMIADMLASLPEAERPSYTEAVDQVAGFVRQYPTPASLRTAIRQLNPPLKEGPGDPGPAAPGPSQ